MKKSLLVSLVFFLAAAIFVTASPDGSLQRMMKQTPINAVNMDVKKNVLNVSMDVDLSKVQVGYNKVYYIIPIITKGDQQLELTPIGLYSRGRFLSNQRSGADIAKKGEMAYRSNMGGKVLSDIHYAQSIPFEPWMDGSTLELCYREYGCCDHLLAEERQPIASYQRPVPPAQVVFAPKFIYVRPEAESRKDRSVSGEAYVTFPVNRTEVYPDYHDNQRELGKIRATIDSVRLDRDVTITRIWLKGYASPEGSYANNERLARGRSFAIRDYVQGLYPIAASVYSVDYEPENWEGLRNYVLSNQAVGNNLAILDIIDSGGQPDAREWRIKNRFPREYRYLLENCYPYLRRTDYKVEYTIRAYTDIREILEVFRTRPQNLSLNELYLVAGEYPEGSEQFNEVFDIAVRMYPNDPVANLNAAMAEMEAGNLNRAAKYLERAGERPEVIYARGIREALQGNWDAALTELRRAQSRGVAEASDAMNQISLCRQYEADAKAFIEKYGKAAL